MDGPGDYYAKWNKPVRERHLNIVWFHLYVEPNEQNKPTNKIETDSDTENRLAAVRVEGAWGWAQ